MGVTPANVAEASVTEAISEDLQLQRACLKELHIDRAYLSSHLVRERSEDLEVYCKAWPVRDSKQFHKQAFALDWERQTIQCPAKQEMPFVPGGVVHFPKEICAQCPLQAQCTTSSKGRSVSIHPDEALLIELRQRQQTDASTSQTARTRGGGAYPCPCGSMARATGTLSRPAQKSLRSAPLRRRPQPARPGSLSAANCRASHCRLIT